MTEASLGDGARVRSRTWVDVASVVTALGALLAVLWPLRRMQFGVVDDHDLLQLGGPGRRLPVGDLVPTFLDVQDAAGRVRPVFWAGRLLELVAWGPHVELWYASRAVLACVTLVAVFLVVRRYVPGPAAAALALLPVLGLQSETWMRLAAAESYAMPLLCVGLCAITGARARARGPAAAGWGYLVLVLAAGSKESFVPVVGLVLVVVVLLTWRELQVRDRVTVLTALAATSALGVWVLVQVATAGEQYQQERTLASALDVARFEASHLDLAWYLVLAALVLTIAGWSLRPRLGRDGRLIGAAIALGWLSQILLYAGGAQVGRYLYPLALLPVALGVLAAAPLRRTSDLRRVLGWSVVALALALPLAVDVPAARDDAVANVAVTRSFHDDLARIRDEVRATGVGVVVLQPELPERDAELVLSLSRYLRDLPVVVMTTPSAGTGSSALDRSLADDLRRWSTSGHESLVPLDRSRPCLALVLGEQTPVCATSLQVLRPFAG